MQDMVNGGLQPQEYSEEELREVGLGLRLLQRLSVYIHR